MRMDEILPTQPVRKTTAYYKAAVEDLLAAMNRLDEQMDTDRAKNEHLKIETQEIKAETQVIKARTEATLAQLQEQIRCLLLPNCGKRVWYNEKE